MAFSSMEVVQASRWKAVAEMYDSEAAVGEELKRAQAELEDSIEVPKPVSRLPPQALRLVYSQHEQEVEAE